MRPPDVMDPASLLEEVVVSLRQLRDNSYVQVVGVSWLAYDIVLTLPSEVEHVWRRKFTLPSLLYLVCRYYALAHLVFLLSMSIAVRPPIQVCRASIYVSAFGVSVLSWAVDLLLVLRLHSIYGRKWNLTGPLVTFYLLQEAITVGMAIDSVLHIKVAAAPPTLSSWPGCFTTTNYIPRYVVAAWATAMIFGAVIFGLTINKLLLFRRMQHTPSKVLFVFVRDGALFFALITVLHIINVVVLATAPLPLFTIVFPLQSAVYGIAISRLMLNLRASIRKGEESTCGETAIEFHISGRSMTRP